MADDAETKGLFRSITSTQSLVKGGISGVGMRNSVSQETGPERRNATKLARPGIGGHSLACPTSMNAR